jgi:hypothetical protein
LVRTLKVRAPDVLVATLAAALVPSLIAKIDVVRRAVDLLPSYIGPAAISHLVAALQHIDDLIRTGVESIPGNRDVQTELKQTDVIAAKSDELLLRREPPVETTREKGPVAAGRSRSDPQQAVISSATALRRKIVSELRKLNWPRTLDDWPLVLEDAEDRAVAASLMPLLEAIGKRDEAVWFIRVLSDKENVETAKECGRLIKTIVKNEEPEWLSFLCRIAQENRTSLPSVAVNAIAAILRLSAGAATESDLRRVAELDRVYATHIEFVRMEDFQGDNYTATYSTDKRVTRRQVSCAEVNKLARDELARRGLG